MENHRFWSEIAGVHVLHTQPLPLCSSAHVQYTEPESIRLKHLTIRLNSHATSRLDSHGDASRKSTSGTTNRQQGKRFVSIRQHFQPTLYSPPEVKIRKITIHEPSSFLKRGHKPQSIRTIRVDSIESTRIESTRIESTHPQSPDQTVWNRVHESISGLSNRKHQRRIDSSWVYWTTLGIRAVEEQD